MRHESFIIILSSPSGAGKTSLANALIKEDPDLQLSISVTTRPKRSNEIPDVDYYFISQDEYDNMLKNNQLLEHAQIFDYFYGAPRHKVEDALAIGKDVIFSVDWQGASNIRSVFPKKTVTVFILPPSLEILEQRLRDRGTETEEMIAKRLAKAKEEISKYIYYDYSVVNYDFQMCISDIKAIIHSERLKRVDRQHFIKKHFT